MSHAAGPEDKNGRSWLTPKLVLGAVIGILALVFVFQNTRNGRFTFLFWEANAPAWLWMLVLFLAGMVVGSIFPWFRRRRG
ncbi:lipopolysaccharide assembly protein LapA domain-containing protein [Longispora albida]|uniref:lipopolysaccharide assembly protein LapA domain-containing protein n=1 Tax=Longispora albida TaxID=203523 RepID=UPI000381AD95|nr:lipopolysaccharide assembly protein LapA domain-containing protein [Longispora albida]